MDYVKVENGQIIKFVPRPDWRDDNGNPVDDSILIQEGYYPVDYESNKPTYDPFYQKIRPKHGFQDWQIQSDKVIVAYEITEKTLDEKKEELRRKIKQWFNDIQLEGYFSNTINAKINSTRLDLDNMKNLYDYMIKNNISSTQFRIYDNSFVDITPDQLQSMIDELIGYGLQLYHEKWDKESQVMSCSTMEELKQVAQDLQLI